MLLTAFYLRLEESMDWFCFHYESIQKKRKKIGFKIAQASQIKVKRNLHPNALVENNESSMNQQHYFVFSFWTLKYILKQYHGVFWAPW